MLYLQEMDLWLGTKIYWFDQNPKKCSDLPSIVTATFGIFIKRRPNIRNMPLLKISESRLTASALEAVNVHLSEKKGFMVIAHFLRKLPNGSCVQYKYSFLRYCLLFNITGVKSLFGLSLPGDCLGLNFELWRQIGASKFCIDNLK